MYLSKDPQYPGAPCMSPPLAFGRITRSFAPARDDTVGIGVALVSACEIMLGVVIFMLVCSAALQKMLPFSKRFSHRDWSML